MRTELPGRDFLLCGFLCPHQHWMLFWLENCCFLPQLFSSVKLKVVHGQTPDLKLTQPSMPEPPEPQGMQQTQLMRTTRWQLINTPWMFSTWRENLHCQHWELTWFSKRKSPSCCRQDIDISSTFVPPRVNLTTEQKGERNVEQDGRQKKGGSPILFMELISDYFAISQTQEHPSTLEKFPSKSVTGRVQAVAELLLTPAGESEAQSWGWAWVI